VCVRDRTTPTNDAIISMHMKRVQDERDTHKKRSRVSTDVVHGSTGPSHDLDFAQFFGLPISDSDLLDDMFSRAIQITDTDSPDILRALSQLTPYEAATSHVSVPKRKARQSGLEAVLKWEQEEKDKAIDAQRLTQVPQDLRAAAEKEVVVVQREAPKMAPKRKARQTAWEAMQVWEQEEKDKAAVGVHEDVPYDVQTPALALVQTPAPQDLRARAVGGAGADTRATSADDAFHGRTLYPSGSERKRAPFMTMMTSVDGRVDLLTQTRGLVATASPNPFYVTKKLKEDDYVLVQEGCVKKEHTHACLEYRDGLIVPFVIKDIPARAGCTTLDAFFAGRWEENSIREILFSRLLSNLVESGVTPHFPILYSSAYNGRSNQIVSERCNETFLDFLNTLSMVYPVAFRNRLLRVALLQLVHGLAAAQRHYGFLHADLHAKNAMVSYIDPVVYTYKVGGKYFSVPTYGMCWKVIDFGQSSAAALPGTDNADMLVKTAVLDRLRHGSDRAFAIIKTAMSTHAAEMFDILRLLSYSMKTVASKAWDLELELKAVVDLATRVSADARLDPRPPTDASWKPCLWRWPRNSKLPTDHRCRHTCSSLFPCAPSTLSFQTGGWLLFTPCETSEARAVLTVCITLPSRQNKKERTP
jgi:hypothetical protein